MNQLAALAQVDAKKTEDFFNYIAIHGNTLSSQAKQSIISGIGGGIGPHIDTLINVIHQLVTHVVYASYTSEQQIHETVLKSHEQLQFAAALCWKNQGAWKRHALNRVPSGMNKLVRVDWRVDVAAASNRNKELNLPCVLVQLDTKDTAGDPSTTLLELDSETLQAMLSGLGKIAEQLSGL